MFAASRAPMSSSREQPNFFFDQKATQPVCVQTVRRLGISEIQEGQQRHRDSGTRWRGAVGHEIEDFELSPPDACQHIAHAVVVAKLGVFVSDAGIAGLLGPETRFVHPGGIWARRAFRRRLS